MSNFNNSNTALDSFQPRFSIALLFQKRNRIALRVFLSDAQNEKEALREATNFYSYVMNSYTLLQTVVANLSKVSVDF